MDVISGAVSQQVPFTLVLSKSKISDIIYGHMSKAGNARQRGKTSAKAADLPPP